MRVQTDLGVRKSLQLFLFLSDPNQVVAWNGARRASVRVHAGCREDVPEIHFRAPSRQQM